MSLLRPGYSGAAPRVGDRGRRGRQAPPVAGRDSVSDGHRDPPDSLAIILRPLTTCSPGGVEAMVNLP